MAITPDKLDEFPELYDNTDLFASDGGGIPVVMELRTEQLYSMLRVKCKF